MEVSDMRKVVCVVVIDEGRILLVRKGDFWILPGGKPETGENDLDCLMRELGEELSGLEMQPPFFLGEFIGTAPYKGYTFAAQVYMASGSGEVVPKAEINAAKWTDQPESYNLSDVLVKVVAYLRQQGYL